MERRDINHWMAASGSCYHTFRLEYPPTTIFLGKAQPLASSLISVSVLNQISHGKISRNHIKRVCLSSCLSEQEFDAVDKCFADVNKTKDSQSLQPILNTAKHLMIFHTALIHQQDTALSSNDHVRQRMPTALQKLIDPSNICIQLQQAEAAYQAITSLPLARNIFPALQTQFRLHWEEKMTNAVSSLLLPFLTINKQAAETTNTALEQVCVHGLAKLRFHQDPWSTCSDLELQFRYRQYVVGETFRVAALTGFSLTDEQVKDEWLVRVTLRDQLTGWYATAKQWELQCSLVVAGMVPYDAEHITGLKGDLRIKATAGASAISCGTCWSQTCWPILGRNRNSSSPEFLDAFHLGDSGSTISHEELHSVMMSLHSFLSRKY